MFYKNLSGELGPFLCPGNRLQYVQIHLTFEILRGCGVHIFQYENRLLWIFVICKMAFELCAVSSNVWTCFCSMSPLASKEDCLVTKLVSLKD